MNLKNNHSSGNSFDFMLASNLLNSHCSLSLMVSLFYLMFHLEQHTMNTLLWFISTLVLWKTDIKRVRFIAVVLLPHPFNRKRMCAEKKIRKEELRRRIKYFFLIWFISCGSLLKHFLKPTFANLPISVSPSFINQVLIEIIDASSVITWDFDMCKGDVVFNIYHSKRAPQPPRKDALGAHGITSPGGNNVQLIDKSWTLGQDYSMVESPLTCKEGESVQVSFQDWKLIKWP